LIITRWARREGLAIIAATKKKAGKGESIIPEEVEIKPEREEPAEMEKVTEPERPRARTETRRNLKPKKGKNQGVRKRSGKVLSRNIYPS